MMPTVHLRGAPADDSEWTETVSVAKFLVDLHNSSTTLDCFGDPATTPSPLLGAPGAGASAAHVPPPSPLLQMSMTSSIWGSSPSTSAGAGRGVAAPRAMAWPAADPPRTIPMRVDKGVMAVMDDAGERPLRQARRRKRASAAKSAVYDQEEYVPPPTTRVKSPSTLAEEWATRIKARTKKGGKLRCDFEGCSATLARLEDLKIHLRRHTGERPYACTVDGCTATFASQGVLRGHLKTHSTEKPHTCTVCGRAFLQRSNCRRHMLTHVPTKPYKCLVTGCSSAFRQRTSLVNHYKNSHPGKPLPPPHSLEKGEDAVEL